MNQNQWQNNPRLPTAGHSEILQASHAQPTDSYVAPQPRPDGTGDTTDDKSEVFLNLCLEGFVILVQLLTKCFDAQGAVAARFPVGAAKPGDIPASTGLTQNVEDPARKQTVATQSATAHGVSISVHADGSSVTPAQQPRDVAQSGLSIPAGGESGQPATPGAAASSAAIVPVHAAPSKVTGNASDTSGQLAQMWAGLKYQPTVEPAEVTVHQPAEQSLVRDGGMSSSGKVASSTNVSGIYADVGVPNSTTAISRTQQAADTVMAEVSPVNTAAETCVAADAVMAESLSPSGAADTLAASNTPAAGAPRPCDAADTSAGLSASQTAAGGVPMASANAAPNAAPAGLPEELMVAF